ncbi:hypothetical protein L6164_010633 [Bauhinia variegata]|uniref:Uncharacterized protein n=1 Tax=Bauhinia variegata TaxID=167791 RepID=A0ACB9PQN3_BAUVA|nr:hypothetical protein L6164_010633 [Bauhinia variegata]
MEPNENQLSSYYHHQQQQSTTSSVTPTTAVATNTPSRTNGLLPHTEGSHMVYPHSVPSAVSSQLEPAKRKRGRPRKYVTPEQALAAKKAALSSSHTFSSKDKESTASASSSYTGFSKRSFALGNAGQGFTPHVITVAAGEDVAQKIMLFTQQSMREICILSASGSISNASLRQPATSGGNVAYEGRFEIISLSGSYVRTELGERTGGLSVCLSSTDGQIIGGGVGGPLKAAGPVQVIVGTFFIDHKKVAGGGVKGDASVRKLPSPVGESASGLSFRPAMDSCSGNPIRGNDDHQHQTIGGSHFMIQQQGMHMAPSRPTDWVGRLDSRSAGYELTGRTGHGAQQSPENGDYDQIPD